MKQKINFLKTLPPQPLQLQAKWITRITLAVIAALTLISFIMAIYQVRASFTMNKIRTENKDAITKFQHTAKLYPLLSSETPLIEQIATAEKKLQEKKNHYAVLTKTALRHGFSNYLRTLATIIPEGLWLREIAIDQETHSASLGGYMLKPISVAMFMQELQKTPAFAEMKFNLFYVKQNPQEAYIAFKIANSALNTEKK